jgi:hypothetical protein
MKQPEERIPQAGGTRRAPPRRPPAPPAASEPGGQAPSGLVGLEYFAGFGYPRKVWPAIKRLNPPHTMVDGRIRFRKAELDEWLAAHLHEVVRSIRRPPRHRRAAK